jgi:hypothetical protein
MTKYALFCCCEIHVSIIIYKCNAMDLTCVQTGLVRAWPRLNDQGWNSHFIRTCWLILALAADIAGINPLEETETRAGLDMGVIDFIMARSWQLADVECNNASCRNSLREECSRYSSIVLSRKSHGIWLGNFHNNTDPQGRNSLPTSWTIFGWVTTSYLEDNYRPGFMSIHITHHTTFKEGSKRTYF